MLEDRYLVWRLKRGSTQALCRIYNRYESDLLTLATSLLGRTGQAVEAQRCTLYPCPVLGHNDHWCAQKFDF